MAEVSSSNEDGKDRGSPKLFDPSVDMLVHDFDEESTLEEEEVLAAEKSEDLNAELSSLQKESSIPLEELLALYGYHSENEENDSPVKQESDSSEPMEEQESEPESETEVDDFSSDEDNKKKIKVGGDHQAQIPEDLCHYNDALPYQNNDKLLWDPLVINADVTEDFLKKAAEISNPPIPLGSHLKDDEQALYLLQQCGHNVEEALKRLKTNVVPSSETMCLWSDKEYRNFKAGLSCYGKNFRKIQQYKLPSRSVGELVQFYYLWKKTELHDIFVKKTRF